MDKVQHDEETIFKRASFAKLNKSEAGFRLDNFEFLHPTSSDWPNLLANEILENLKASTSICFNSIWDPC